MSIFYLQFCTKMPVKIKKAADLEGRDCTPGIKSILLCFQGWLRSCGNKVSPVLQHVDLNVEVLCWTRNIHSLIKAM